MPIQYRPKSKVCSGQVVEAVLQLMEQGPQPMRNMRPTKRNPNATDRFQSDHQAGYEEYEAREDRNLSRKVDLHNAACPKMRDELDRRRSTAKASPPIIFAKRRPNEVYFDPNCSACQKLKRAADKKQNSKTKSRRRDKRQPEKSRVSKPRRAQRKAKSTFGLARIRTNKACQYYSQYTNKATVANVATNVEGTDELGEVLYISNKNTREKTSQAGITNPTVSQNASKSDVVSRNPDTSANSLSSYNSNMSLDHEPMVSH